MQLSVVLSSDQSTFVCIGECAACKRGNNSLIITSGKKLTPKVMSVNLTCVCCGSSYKAKLQIGQLSE